MYKIECKNCDISDLSLSIFENLRVIYPNFDNWYKKISDEGRLLYYVKNNHSIISFFIVKEKEESLKLCSFFVDKKYRKLGIGNLMISYIKGLTYFQNFKNVYLSVRQDNSDTTSFFKSHGFNFIDKVGHDYYYQLSY